MATFFGSDAQLDAAYDEAMTKKNYARANELASVIVDRIGVLDFMDAALFGGNDFPLYEKWMKFGAQDARQSIAASAGQVATTIGETSKQIAAGAAGIAVPLLLAAGAMAYGFGKHKRS